MGGVAAVAGALGPTIGGGLTSAISWRAVLLVNVPLAVLCVVATLRSVRADAPPTERPDVDLVGAALLSLTLVGLAFGFSQTQTDGWGTPGVYVPLAASAVAAVLFVVRERRTRNPLMSLSLLRRHRNYIGATVSQALAGMAEMASA